MPVARKLFVELGVNDRKLSSGLRKSEKKFKTFGRKVSREMGRTFSKLKLAAGGGAAFGFVAAAEDVRRYETVLENMRVQAERTVNGMAGIRRELTKTSSELGLDRSMLAEGVDELVTKLGSDGLSAKNIKTVGAVIRATGAEAREVARVMLGLTKSMEIDPSMAKEAISIIHSIGKEGSVTFAEAAKEIPSLAASWVDAGGSKGKEGVKQMMAMLQIAGPAFGDGARGANGMIRVLEQLGNRAKEIKDVFGVDVFDAAGGRRDPLRVFKEIADSEKASAEDKRNVLAAFGKQSGANKMLNTFLKKQSEFEGLSALADEGKIDRDVADKMSSPIVKLEKATNNMKLAFAKAFTPERIQKFAQAIEKLADLIGAMVDNLQTMVGLWAAAKFGPGAAGLALAGGRAYGGKDAIGASSIFAKGSAAKGFGLVAAAGAVGFAFGTLIDRTLGLSNKLSSAALDVLGPWNKVAEAAPSGRIGALKERLAKGEISKREFDKGRAKQVGVFAFRGADAVTALVGEKIREKNGTSLETQRERFKGFDETRTAEIREMARQVLISQAQGLDTTALIDKIAAAIQGAPINVSISGETISKVNDKIIDVRNAT